MQGPGCALQGPGYSQCVSWTGWKGCEVNGTIYEVGTIGAQALWPTRIEFPFGAPHQIFGAQVDIREAEELLSLCRPWHGKPARISYPGLCGHSLGQCS